MSLRVHWRGQHAVSYTVQPEWEEIKKKGKKKRKRGKKSSQPAGWGELEGSTRGRLMCWKSLMY